MIWRIATLRLRMPPPTGVVNGPLIPTRCSLNASMVVVGQPLPRLVESFLTGEDLFPRDRSGTVVCLLHGCVEDADRSRPDVWADAVALDEGNRWVIGYLQPGRAHGDVGRHGWLLTGSDADYRR